MEMRSDTGSSDLALVHPQIEAVGMADRANDLHGPGRQSSDLNALGIGGLGPVRDMAIRAHEEMSRVVRVEVHEHIGALAPIDDQGLPVLPVGSRAEGALAA